MLGVGNDLLLAAEHRIEGGPRRVGRRRGHLGDEVVRDDGVLLFAQHILQLGTLLDEPGAGRTENGEGEFGRVPVPLARPPRRSALMCAVSVSAIPRRCRSSVVLPT